MQPKIGSQHQVLTSCMQNDAPAHQEAARAACTLAPPEPPPRCRVLAYGRIVAQSLELLGLVMCVALLQMMFSCSSQQEATSPNLRTAFGFRSNLSPGRALRILRFSRRRSAVVGRRCSGNGTPPLTRGAFEAG